MNVPHKQNANLHLQLHRKAFQHINKPQPGMTVMCKKGILWLTQTGVNNDYTLLPGERLVLKNQGDLLIEAMQEADLSILFPN